MVYYNTKLNLVGVTPEALSRPMVVSLPHQPDRNPQCSAVVGPNVTPTEAHGGRPPASPRLGTVKHNKTNYGWHWL